MNNKKPKQEVLIFWFVIFCIAVPQLIVTIYQARTHSMTPEEVRMAKLAGTFVTTLLNLLLVAKGEYKLVLFHSKDYDPKKIAEQAAKKTVPPKPAPPASGSTAPEYGGDAEVPYRIITDPMTKAQTLYNWDEESGQWVSQDGRSVLDESRLDEWYKQRQSDREWQDRENEKIRRGDTAFDRELRKMKEESDREIARMEEESRRLQEHYKHYGTWETDPEKLKEIIQNRIDLADIEGRIASRQGNTYAAIEWGLTALSKICDYGVDILAEFTGGAGKGIKAAYIGARNIGYRYSEARVYGRDMDEAMRLGISETVVDNVQAFAPKSYRYYANVGGDMYKKAMQNAYDRKDISEGVIESGIGGAVRTKLQNVVEGKFDSMYRNTTKQSASQVNRYLEHFTSGKTSEKVFNICKTNTRTASAQTLKTIKTGKTVATNLTQDIITKLFN